LTQANIFILRAKPRSPPKILASAAFTPIHSPKARERWFALTVRLIELYGTGESAMEHLDAQLRNWATRLRDDLGIAPPASNELATAICREVSELGPRIRFELRQASPISLEHRLDELVAFQAWMDVAHDVRHPAITRAQVITQNYVCFVYLGDAWFKQLSKVVAATSVTRKCCRFLADNPVRAFRNAIAHANWKYNSSFTGLEFWARRGSDPNEAMERFEVNQNDLNFWQTIARCTAYASMTAVGRAE
jgi:hypothetical protein